MAKKWLPVPGFIGFVTLIAKFLIQDGVLLLSKWNIITRYLVIFNFRVGYLKKSSGRVGYRDPIGPCSEEGKYTSSTLRFSRTQRTWTRCTWAESVVYLDWTWGYMSRLSKHLHSPAVVLIPKNCNKSFRQLNWDDFRDFLWRLVLKFSNLERAFGQICERCWGIYSDRLIHAWESCHFCYSRISKFSCFRTTMMKFMMRMRMMMMTAMIVIVVICFCCA